MIDLYCSPKLSRINKALRTEREVQGWREASLYHNKYTCVISGRKYNLIVHHIKGFDTILQEAVQELSSKKKLSSAWFREPWLTNELRDLFLMKHRDYGLGVTLHKKIHDEFHHRYGYHNNSNEQFEEFKSSITKERVEYLLAVPEPGDLICSKCGKVAMILFDDTCPKCSP
ncbi:hypothetical protein AABM38_02695 [Heyndrickxia sp. MSNUG]|uniref:hypothetical protein n=1 Tax=Heyndrickxia sp. MSNUG TaxID=3136677 RepID=UPI003C2ACB90